MWPENERAILFFAGMGQGAWLHGMNGPSGLRYEALPFQLEMAGIRKKHWPEVFRAVRVMESAALEAMHSKA